MPSTLNPYLNFKDNTREAMEFYRGVFGGKLDVSTFSDNNASPRPQRGEQSHARGS
jgi:PhnB protein